MNETGQRRFWQVVNWSIVSVWRWWCVIFCVAVFVLIGASSAFRGIALAADSAPSVTVRDVLLIAFSGPQQSDMSMRSFLPWFFPQLLFFVFTGDNVSGELCHRGYAVLPRVGSRRIWWGAKVMVLCLFALGYSLLGMGSGLVGVMLVGQPFWSMNAFTQPLLFDDICGSNGGKLLFWLGILWSSTLFALSACQALCAMVTRRSVYGLIMIIIVVLASVLLGIVHADLVRWLPGSQFILLRHTICDSQVPNFSLVWSLLYNTIVAGSAISAGYFYIARLDILSFDEH
jgi:hypothetical protein